MLNEKLFPVLVAAIVLLVIANLASVYFLLGHVGRCEIIYGPSICHFYAARDLESTGNASTFIEAVAHCQQMPLFPKRDACFAEAAWHYGDSTPEGQAREMLACNQIQEYDNVYNRTECLTEIGKPKN